MTITELVKKIKEEKKRIKKEQRKARRADEGIRLDGRRAGLDWVLEKLQKE